eukprot:Nitzschia sp. Nitz4//scaffold16_size188269//174378//181326//NITZ4_001819-RA/size188269-augustus-gene-0.84-mRNA-1//1//CDS//3329538601//6866//frame0
MGGREHNKTKSVVRKNSFKEKLAQWSQRETRTNDLVRLAAKKRYSGIVVTPPQDVLSPKKKSSGKISPSHSPKSENRSSRSKGAPSSPLPSKVGEEDIKLTPTKKGKSSQRTSIEDVAAEKVGHPLKSSSKTRRVRKVRTSKKKRTQSVRAKLLKEFDDTNAFTEQFASLKLKDAKDKETKALLRSALKHNFVFEKLDEAAIDLLIQGFEPVPTCDSGKTIITQGKDGDYFYVIESGKVTYQVNGSNVGTASKGDSFGELALLYTCPRAATVVANTPTRLWKLEQTIFRMVLRNQTEESLAGKYNLLKNIEFFAQMEEEDVKHCLDVMTPRRFEAGERIVSKGEVGDAFYVIQSGSLKVTDISVGDTTYEDVQLGPGDFFGERALVKSEPRAANVTGVTAGSVFAIDRATFEKVCGSLVRLILKSQDKSRLSGLKVLRAAKLDPDQTSELSQLLADELYHQNKVIFKSGSSTKPALYLVREGSVKIKYASGQEKVVIGGGYFGEDQLLADALMATEEDDTVLAKYTAEALENGTLCGVLSLKDCRTVFDTTSIELSDSLRDEEFYGMSEPDEDEFKGMVGRRSLKRSSVDMSGLPSSLVKEVVLGEGNFGEVWKVSSSLDVFADSSKFALKIQSKDDSSRACYSALEAFRRECDVLASIDHPFVVDLIHHYEDEDNSYMVMGLIPGGELWSIIHVQDEQGDWHSGFSEVRAKFIALVVADTLPENIMIDKDGYPIIIDFGFAKELEDGITYTFCGTPQYICPEIATNAGHGFAVDNWALGVVIYEMVSGENPFWYDGIDNLKLLSDICRETPFPLPETCSNEVYDLIHRLLEKSPTERLGSLAMGSREIKTHPWFEGLDLVEIRERRWEAPFVPELDWNEQSRNHTISIDVVESGRALSIHARKRGLDAAASSSDPAQKKVCHGIREHFSTPESTPKRETSQQAKKTRIAALITPAVISYAEKMDEKTELSGVDEIHAEPEKTSDISGADKPIDPRDSCEEQVEMTPNPDGFGEPPNESLDIEDKDTADPGEVAEGEVTNENCINPLASATAPCENASGQVQHFPPCMEGSNPNSKFDKALSRSTELLRQLQEHLHKPENEPFCSDFLRKNWTEEISQCLRKTAPDTIIGCLGNTGVGKSSLLNALLDEAAVLPTSGSRGCTAAVVELRYNDSLVEPTAETPVYVGEVEFISLSNWWNELDILLNECCSNETKMVYLVPPQAHKAPEAAASWAKIDQVYGKKTMEGHKGKHKQQVFHELSRDPRIFRLLQGKNGNPTNSITVNEGCVNAQDARLLLGHLSTVKGQLKRKKKKWAKEFRAKINSYVYRAGNGDGPQTWPLIRKVVLRGPWAVLSSGACLVDMPGVRDANAARAKVAQTYLQNCNHIWIVAPIKRAVDDGTAKELLGEQFRRQLLMDGQYGNVSFICTQTDDCETTEIMRDHEDIARAVEGRWERMNLFLEQIGTVDQCMSELVQREEQMQNELEDVQISLKALQEDIDDIGDAGETDVLAERIAETKSREEELVSQLSLWSQENGEKMESLREKSHSLQKELKAIAAGVRNEYSTKCLEDDFKAGLQELTDGLAEDEPVGNTTTGFGGQPNHSIPDDCQLDVYCVASNDYLKIQGVKPPSDGPPNTFARADETQIPTLRAAIHEVTSKFRETFAVELVQKTDDILGQVRLCATEGGGNTTSAHAIRQCFDREMKSLDSTIEPIANNFVRKIEQKTNTNLKSCLVVGASNGKAQAMSIVRSWSSNSRRNKYERAPNKNGLYYSTYHATLRRGGVFNSASAGEIDLNQELCDPVEKAFGAEWQRIMDASIRASLGEAERQVSDTLATLTSRIVKSMTQAGMEAARLQNITNAGNRACGTALKISFAEMRNLASCSQRELNRSLLPTVSDRMHGGYSAALNVQRGMGTFRRMAGSLEGFAQGAVVDMFDEATNDLLTAVRSLIKQLATLIRATSSIIRDTNTNVYAVCWDMQQTSLEKVSPEMLAQIQDCRDKFLPFLNKLPDSQGETMGMLGLSREEVEFDVVGVDTWEDRMEKELKVAQSSGKYFELLDSDDERVETLQAMNLKPAFLPVKVKPERF